MEISEKQWAELNREIYHQGRVLAGIDHILRWQVVNVVANIMGMVFLVIVMLLVMLWK